MERKTRKPLRRDGADYSAVGAYFVTICTKNRQKLFWDMEQYDPQTIAQGYENAVGAIINRPHCQCPLTACGKIAEAAIIDIPRYYPTVAVDHFVIMPNHIHMILSLCDEGDGRLVIAPTDACDAIAMGEDRGRLVIAPTEACDAVAMGGDCGRLVIAPTDVCDAVAMGGDCGRLVIAPTVSMIVRQFKTAVTKTVGTPLWQRSFHDRIIRDREEYALIAKYIYENPLCWMYDEHYI